LADVDARKSQVVELRYFGGLSVEDTAAALDVSADTVMRDWRLARGWLAARIERQVTWERGASAGITLQCAAVGRRCYTLANFTERLPMSVSRRNFIKGVIAGGAVASSSAYLFRSGTLSGQTSTTPGSVERLITLSVNGQARRVDVMKQETLAMTLRYKLGLTGTKLGCDRAECGACTVLIDDVPHYSCSVLTHTVRNRRVTTIEGLAASSGELHPISRRSSTNRDSSARSACPASSCPRLASSRRIRARRARKLAHGVSGNLCRCQDYDKILTALMKGAEYMRRV
jgi:aerobic-type carbon monoxide dehydrogenase small subunit (CoxS/CutS family)